MSFLHQLSAPLRTGSVPVRGTTAVRRLSARQSLPSTLGNQSMQRLLQPLAPSADVPLIQRQSVGTDETTPPSDSSPQTEPLQGSDCRGREPLPINEDFEAPSGNTHLPSQPRTAFCIRRPNVHLLINASWQEQIPDPSQRSPSQRRRRPSAPNYLVHLIQSGGRGFLTARPLRPGRQERIDFAHVNPGFYRLHINTIPAQGNRVLVGHYALTED